MQILLAEIIMHPLNPFLSAGYCLPVPQCPLGAVASITSRASLLLLRHTGIKPVSVILIHVSLPSTSNHTCNKSAFSLTLYQGANYMFSSLFSIILKNKALAGVIKVPAT